MHGEDDIERAQHESPQGRLDLGHREGGVGARRDRDLVLARPVDHDQGDAGRLTREDGDLRDVHAGRREGVPGLRAEGIVADRTHECDARPEPGGGHRLVPALPAVEPREPPTDDRLAGRRQAGARDHQVAIERADHDDATRSHRRWAVRQGSIWRSANTRLAGRSASRRTYHGYQNVPYATRIFTV